MCQTIASQPMKYALFAGALFVISGLAAQSPATEIDQQVWKVFIEGYNSFDTDKFMSVYSKDVIRIPVDEKKIFNFIEYRRNINRENQFNKNYNIKAKIELRFIHRIHNGDQAFEEGIYKISLTDNNGRPATLYSRFQVYMRKENGVWKIRYDTDSTDEGNVAEKDFINAQPMSGI